MKTLFEIGGDLAAFRDLLEEIGGDITEDVIEAAIDEWFLENRNNLSQKLDGYGFLMREFEAKAAARKSEGNRILGLAKTDENAVKRLKDRLKSFFEEHGIDKVETPNFKLSLANNGGKAPLIIDPEIDAAKLPERFRRVKYEPDTDAIRAAIEAGEKLDFAQIGDRGRSIRIK